MQRRPAGSNCLLLVVVFAFVAATSTTQTKSSTSKIAFKQRHLKKLNEENTLTRMEKPKYRILQGSNRNAHAMRVEPFYQLLDFYTSKNSDRDSMAQMTKRIMNRAAGYVKAFFRVTSNQSITIPAFCCFGLCCANDFTGSFDLLVVFQPMDTDEYTNMASAGSCMFDYLNDRPVAGIFFLNMRIMKATPRREYAFFNLFIHELFHIMGFISYLFTDFLKEPGGSYSENEIYAELLVNGSSWKAFKLPHVAQVLKAYFACESLPGMPLENEADSEGKGSHWEKLFLTHEVMSPTFENYQVISDFSIALLRDTGWYTIDPNGAQTIHLNKADGCALFEKCPKVRGYCAASDIGKTYCSSDYKTKSTCSSSSYTEKCGYLSSSMSICEIHFDADPHLKDATETYGPSSRCIEWKTNDNQVVPKCHKTECINGNTLKIVLSDGRTFICDARGKKLKVDKTNSIACPDTADFCSKFAQRCSDDCYMNGAGMCMKDNSCYCFLGTDPTTGRCKVDPAFTTPPAIKDTDDQISSALLLRLLADFPPLIFYSAVFVYLFVLN